MKKIMTRDIITIVCITIITIYPQLIPYVLILATGILTPMLLDDKFRKNPNEKEGWIITFYIIMIIPLYVSIEFIYYEPITALLYILGIIVYKIFEKNIL